MDRRTFVTSVTGVLVTASIATKGQQGGRIYRIGVLTSSGLTRSGNPRWEAFIQRMREHGWVEKQNLLTDIRYTEGRPEVALKFAQELVEQNVDLIVAGGTQATLAAKQATATIPIVAFALGDPVGTGLVASFARPGGNVTGTSFQGTELTGKQLDLIKDALPDISKVAVLVNPANASHAPRVKEASAAAQSLKVRIDLIEARQASELEAAFGAILRNRDDAALVLTDPTFDREASRITSLAAFNRIPTMYGVREHVLNGGLMSYGASFTALWRQVADYADKILRGAKPADLPIEQPTKFELVINLRTANALGVTIPQSLLIRADEVIQ